MGIVQHTVNGRAILEAIRINGVEHIRGDWFGGLDANGKPTAGCAIGLAAINLGVRGETSENPGANLLEQLDKLEVSPTSRWYKPNYMTPHVAGTIIYWNDAFEWVDGKKIYALPTFEEVHQMAYEILKPYFDTEFVVDVWEFEPPNFDNYEEDDEDY